LSDNTILSIYEDSFGLLWFGTHRGGVNTFDPNSETFTRYKADPSDPGGLGSNDIQAITADKKGTVWILTYDKGLYKFDRQYGKVRRCQPPSTKSGKQGLNQFNSLCLSRSGIFLIGTNEGLKGFDPGKEKYTRHYTLESPDSKKVTSMDISSVVEDRTGEIWVGTYNRGLIRLNPKTGEIARYMHNPKAPNSISSNSISCLYETQSGDLWVGLMNDGGLNKFNREQNNFFSYKSNPNNPLSISQDSIRCIYESREGILWIGTYNRGINKYIPSKKEFTLYRKNPDSPNSLSGNVVTAIFEDYLGMLWVGTGGEGLNRLDRKKNQFTHFRRDPQNPKSLGSNYVFSLYEDRAGGLWIGTLGGLYKYNRTNEAFIRKPLASPGKKEKSKRQGYGFIFAITGDHRGTLWIGTKAHGLFAYTPEKKKIRHYTFEPQNPHSLSHNEVNFIYETRSGNLWVGTSRGLNRYNREKDTFIRYLSDPHDPKSISYNFISSICEDHKGILWIGTFGGGMNKMVEPGPAFIHYTGKQGLPNNGIHRILEDNMGFLWISTNYGLSRFDPVIGTFINYTEKDGLQGNEFTTAFHKSRSGEMFFGGINGFNAFFPETILKNLYVPPLVITRIKIYGSYKTTQTNFSSFKEKPDTDEIVLEPNEHTISLEFAALDYTDPEKNQYAYKLKGTETDWNYIGNKRELVFANLPPGEYLFQLKGSNNSGVWNEKGITRTIKILNPPWEVWPYALAIALFILGGILFFYVFKKEQKKKMRQQEIESEQIFAKFSFSNREKEIIKLLLQGKDKKEIEEELFISAHTVKNYIYNIYQKLEVKNRLQIINLIKKK